MLKSNGKRSLNELSPTAPITPGRKRLQTDPMAQKTIGELTVEEYNKLLEPLAKSEEVKLLEEKITKLQEENHTLQTAVSDLKSRCLRLEEQMQNVYIWKNNRNLIVTLNKGASEEEVKNRVVNICANISKKSDILKKENVWVINSKHSTKTTVKASFKDTEDVQAVIRNTRLLNDTDVSISKDYPKDIREQRGHLLKLRRMIINKTGRKPMLRGNVLKDGNFNIKWCLMDGPKIASGESMMDVYGISQDEVFVKGNAQVDASTA